MATGLDPGTGLFEQFAGYFGEAKMTILSNKQQRRHYQTRCHLEFGIKNSGQR
jgi:hypothetical protein